MLSDDLIILGAGGHCKVVADVISGSTGVRIRAIHDVNVSVHGKFIEGCEVTPWPPLQTIAAPIHIAIGDCNRRADIAEEVLQASIPLYSVISENALISPSAELMLGVFVAAGVIIAADSRIGRATIINHNAVVDHDTMVGDYSHIAPSATLCGGVWVGSRTLIGAGAVVLPGVKVGSGVVIGAGSVVNRDVPNDACVAGMPARGL